MQWHLAMRIKLAVVNVKEKDWISVFLLARGAGFWGFELVPTVLLTTVAEQLFDIMPILLGEQMTSC